MKAVRVIVNGARGRMGTEAILAINAESDMSVVFEADRNDSLRAAIKDFAPDVVVDFTVASAGFENARMILETGTRAVIGTSGFQESDIAKLREISEANSVGAIVAPNFAIGAVLMMKFAKLAAQYLDSVEIIELHHDKKEDFPSGTAIKTAELISENIKMTVEPSEGRAVYRSGIPIHSVRLPGFVAHQEVIFGGLGQVLTIRHDSINRQSFMPGVVLSCRKVMELDSLVYGLENIL